MLWIHPVRPDEAWTVDPTRGVLARWSLHPAPRLVAQTTLAGRELPCGPTPDGRFLCTRADPDVLVAHDLPEGSAAAVSWRVAIRSGNQRGRLAWDGETLLLSVGSYVGLIDTVRGVVIDQLQPHGQVNGVGRLRGEWIVALDAVDTAGLALRYRVAQGRLVYTGDLWRHSDSPWRGVIYYPCRLASSSDGRRLAVLERVRGKHDADLRAPDATRLSLWEDGTRRWSVQLETALVSRYGAGVAAHRYLPEPCLSPDGARVLLMVDPCELWCFAATDGALLARLELAPVLGGVVVAVGARVWVLHEGAPVARDEVLHALGDHHDPAGEAARREAASPDCPPARLAELAGDPCASVCAVVAGNAATPLGAWPRLSNIAPIALLQNPALALHLAHDPRLLARPALAPLALTWTYRHGAFPPGVSFEAIPATLLLRALLVSPHLDEERLHAAVSAHAGLFDRDLWALVALHPRATRDLLAALPKDAQLFAVARTDLTPAEIEALAHGADPRVRAAVAARPPTTPTLREHLARDSSWDVLSALGQDASLPPAVARLLRGVATDPAWRLAPVLSTDLPDPAPPSIFIDAWAAQADDRGPAAATLAARHPAPIVRAGAALSRVLAPDHQRVLCQDPSALVRRTAALSPALSTLLQEAAFAGEREPRVLTALLSRPTRSAAFIDALCDLRESIWLREPLARHPNLPQARMASLLESGSEDVWNALLANPRLPDTLRSTVDDKLHELFLDRGP